MRPLAPILLALGLTACPNDDTDAAPEDETETESDDGNDDTDTESTSTEDTGSTTETDESGTEETDTGGEPCDGACEGDTPYCDEDSDTCVECLLDEHCDDAHACSIDACDLDSSTCTATYDDSPGCEPDWGQLQPQDSPSARAWASMAFDAARGELVMFGGFDGNTLLDDTWTWDGENWTLQSPNTVPDPRFAHGLAYDAARERVVMFGGVPAQFSTMGMDDTWEWDGTDWTLMDPDQSPPGRATHHQFAYDPQRERVVMFGGGTQPSVPVMDDTWEYDGTTWTQVDDATGPVARAAGCMAYGGPGVGTLLFGGGDWDPYHDDTWAWDGQSWTDLDPMSAPSERMSLMCAYDSFRDRVVVWAGGLNPTPLYNDLWEFDGTNWTEQQVDGPDETCCELMAYDSARRQTVVFSAGETWVYGPPG